MLCVHFWGYIAINSHLTHKLCILVDSSKHYCTVCLPNIHLLLCRLVPGGLAESTGLLAVNDEVLEVNGIEVAGKSLDQVNSLRSVLQSKKCFKAMRRRLQHQFSWNFAAYNPFWNSIVLSSGDRHDGWQLQQLDRDSEACQPAHLDGAAKRQLLEELGHVLALHVELVHTERDGERGPRGGRGAGRDRRPPSSSWVQLPQP